MRILNSTNWLRAGFLDSYKDYYSKSEDALAEVQQTLNQGCWFSPEQATAWFTDVLGYYWEYCEARIEEPELLSLQVMGVDAVKVSESEYSLCLPEGVNWKRLRPRSSIAQIPSTFLRQREIGLRARE